MVNNRFPQVHVIFLCTPHDPWRNADPVRFDRIKAEIEAAGGRLWYLCQKGDHQAERDRQYAELRDFIVNQGHPLDSWEVVTNSTDPTLSTEQSFFAEAVKELMWQLREGHVGYIDPVIDWRELLLAMEDSLELVRYPETVLKFGLSRNRNF